MMDLFVCGLIAVILTLAIRYIIKEKKAGAKCIGCSSSKSCGSNDGCSGCGCQNADTPEK